MRAPRPVMEVADYRDRPQACSCQWDPYRKATAYGSEMRWRITEVRPVCEVHGTAKAREDAVKALDAALKLLADQCCGAEFESLRQSCYCTECLGYRFIAWRCPRCGRIVPPCELYPPGEDPCALPSRNIAKGGTGAVIGPAIAVAVEGRLF